MSSLQIHQNHTTPCLPWNMCPILSSQTQDALRTLTNPSLDRLGNQLNPFNKALSLLTFAELKGEELNRIDCHTLRTLYYRMMLMVHPDKLHSDLKDIAIIAARNLNNAFEETGCKKISQALVS